MTSYLNFDFERVTITFESKNRQLVSHLLGGTLESSGLYEGWITDENPSTCPIGFAIFFRYSRIFADFHNLPFYYGRNWEEYTNNLHREVSKHPEGYRFTYAKTGFTFEWSDLRLFIEILEGHPTDTLPPGTLPARVDFEDDWYSLSRVIDGNTITVRPTLHFSASMKDIYVCLYGVVTPDLLTENALRCKNFLEDLCSVDASGKLMIVWERELLGRSYEGYPRDSSEGSLIGHVFFQVAGGEYVYVNGLMQLLRHCSPDEEDNSSSCGYHMVPYNNPAQLWNVSCTCRLLDESCPRSDALGQIDDMHPPRCLLRLEQLPHLDPRQGGMYIDDKLTSRAIKERGCPFDGPIKQQLRELSNEISTQRLSPFDLSLSYLNMWARTRAAITQHGQIPTSPVDKLVGQRSKVENAHKATDVITHEKDVFLIHTRSIAQHHYLVTGITEQFQALGLKVWQYSDWSWTTSDGQVDRETLREVLIKTPAVIAFDVGEETLTPGIREEARIIDRDFDSLFPLGRFALISGTDNGFFANAYPMRLGPILDLPETIPPSAKLVEQVCLFVLRVVIRQSMLHHVLFDTHPDRSAAVLDEWAAKSIELIFRARDTKFDDGDVEIPRLVEELLLWFGSLSKTEVIDLDRQTPRLCQWIAEEFNGSVEHDRLSEHGLEALIDALDVIGSRGHAFLERIRSEPTYWTQEDAHERNFSDSALKRATQILARSQNRSAFDYAREVWPEAGNVKKEWEILAELAETDSEKEVACDYLLARLRAADNDEEIAAACAAALGELGNQAAAATLRHLALNDAREEVRLAAVLSLIDICGPDSQAVVEQFVRLTGKRSRIVVASLAWKIDLDSTYDLLLSLESDPRMLANVQYSLVRAKNPRASQQILSALRSRSSYLRAIAAASTVQLLDWLPADDPFRLEVIPLLESSLDEADEQLHMVAVIALIRASQSAYSTDAGEILAKSLSKGNVSLARTVLVNAALSLEKWPDDRVVRTLLYHSDPSIRGTVCLLVGRQKRTAFVEELNILKRDHSGVPLYGDGSFAELADTVGENAIRALKRL